MKKVIGNLTVTSGTACAVTVGDQERKPAFYVHENDDEFGNGDSIVYSVEQINIEDLTEEDVIDLLRDASSIEEEDLNTFVEEDD